MLYRSDGRLTQVGVTSSVLGRKEVITITGAQLGNGNQLAAAKCHDLDYDTYCQTETSSAGESAPWLALFFDPTPVDKVSIVNRKDCCQDYLGDFLLSYQTVSDRRRNTWSQCGAYTLPASNGAHVFDCDSGGQYVTGLKVQKAVAEDGKPLMLAEVILYTHAVCNDGGNKPFAAVSVYDFLYWIFTTTGAMELSPPPSPPPSLPPPSPPPPTCPGWQMWELKTKQQLQAAVDEWCGTQPPPPALALKYGDISEWDVSEITDMSNLFRGKYTCDPDLSKWNTGKVTTMEDMFYKAAVFNGDLKKWNTASVVNMKGMFQGASLFRRDLSKWNTGAVTNMFAMFARATTFRGFGLSKWNTGAVTTMAYMFAEADAFKGDLRDWNTGAVTTMEGMFSGATSFNSDLHHWNTDQVTTMEDMFKGAAKFINVEFCPSVPGGVVPPKLGNGVDTCPMPSPSAPPPYWGAFG